MIVPAALDLTAYRNSAGQFDLTLTDNGVPLNLTNYSAKLQVRTLPGDTGTSLLSITSDAPTGATSEISFDDPDAGKIGIYVNEADFVNFPSNPLPTKHAIYFYDLLLTPDGGDPAVFVTGHFLFHEGVTR